MNARRLAALVTALVLATGLGAVPASGAPQITFYSRPYTPDLVTGFSSRDGLSVADFSHWVGWGAPRPVPAPTEFLKYPWAPDIWAVSSFGGSEPFWHRLTGAEWARAGHPSPRAASSLPSTDYYQYASSPEIIAYHFGTQHVLSLAEWANAGFPAFRRSSGGYVRLSWDSNIVRAADVEAPGKALPLSFAEWASAGFPTPRVRDTYPGDTFCWISAADMVNDQSPVPHYPEGAIFYDGATYTGFVPREQWDRIGVVLGTTTGCF